MLRATAIVRQEEVSADQVIDTVTLDHDARHRRRIAIKSDRGFAFLLDLDRAVLLGDGDALRLSDGQLVRVRAAAQKLVEITAPTPQQLMKIVWHIGNRHTPAEIGDAVIYIQDDHVLVEMVRSLGGVARIVERPFVPERGAYKRNDGAVRSPGHHHHDHDHD